METLYRSSSRKGSNTKGGREGENNPESQGPNVIIQLGTNFFISNEKILSCTSILEAVKAAKSQYDYTRAPENGKLSQPPLVQGAAESFKY